MLLTLFTGALFNELINCILLLHSKSPDMFMKSSTISKLENMLGILDKFNQLAPGAKRDDEENLSWPGFFGERKMPPSFDNLLITV